MCTTLAHAPPTRLWSMAAVPTTWLRANSAGRRYEADAEAGPARWTTTEASSTRAVAVASSSIQPYMASAPSGTAGAGVPGGPISNRRPAPAPESARVTARPRKPPAPVTAMSPRSSMGEGGATVRLSLAAASAPAGVAGHLPEDVLQRAGHDRRLEHVLVAFGRRCPQFGRPLWVIQQTGQGGSQPGRVARRNDKAGLLVGDLFFRAGHSGDDRRLGQRHPFGDGDGQGFEQAGVDLHVDGRKHLADVSRVGGDGQPMVDAELTGLVPQLIAVGRVLGIADKGEP